MNASSAEVWALVLSLKRTMSSGRMAPKSSPVQPDISANAPFSDT